MTLSDRWSHILEELRRQGRRRSLLLPTGIDFTSNDYLGYAGEKRGPAVPGSQSAVPGSQSAVPGSQSAVPGSQTGVWEPGKTGVPSRSQTGVWEPGKTGVPSRSQTPVWEREGLRSGTASRLLRGHHPIWEEVERRLALWHDCEAALMMTSGYAANEGLLSTVIEPQDWVASDQYNHASLIDGVRLSKAERFIFRHNDLNHLESGLQAAARQRPAGQQLFIVTESLFSMEGDLAPLAEMTELAERYGANLIVDEAHATGCFGRSGSGLVDAAGLRSRVVATVHTGGKALGLAGAYICGSNPLKDLLVNRCRHLIFTTALPPVIGMWWQQTIPFVQRDDVGRQTLHQNAAQFRSLLEAAGIGVKGTAYIISILLGSDRRAVRTAEKIQEQGFDIRAIRPPSVSEGTSRLRISIHADHDAQVIGEAVKAISRSI